MQVTWLSYDKQIPAHCKIIWELAGQIKERKCNRDLMETFPVFWSRVLGTSSSFIELIELQWLSVPNWGKLLREQKFSFRLNSLKTNFHYLLSVDQKAQNFGANYKKTNNYSSSLIFIEYVTEEWCVCMCVIWYQSICSIFYIQKLQMYSVIYLRLLSR